MSYKPTLWLWPTKLKRPLPCDIPCPECDGHGEYILDTTGTGLPEMHPCEYCAAHYMQNEYHYE